MSAGFVALGLVQGALAALNALGLVLLWRTTRVVNLAQPAIGLVGGVITGMLVSAEGWSFWWAAPLGVAVGAALGFASERLVMVRLRNMPRAVPMVATIGLAQLFAALQSGIPFMWGGRLPSYDVDLGVQWFVFPVLLKGAHLLALASLPLAAGGAWWYLHRSRIGVAAVAVGQDAERAEALGVGSGAVRAATWSAAGALSGLAGVLSIPVLGFSLGDGVAPTVLLLALAPAVLAGLRNVWMTALASLAVGVAYQYALVNAPTAGLADAALGLAIVVAVAARRRTTQREAAAERASSWAAGTTPPPLPRAARRDPRWRAVAAVGAVAVVVAAAAPPLWLAPSADVRYGTSAALALAAVAVAAAWAFAGEVALGHWGVAAAGAAAAWLAPGPLPVQAVAAVLVGGALGAGLGAVGRRRGGLASAVAGLAVAIAAPYLILRLDSPSLGVDPGLAAAAAGGAVAACVVALTVVRGRRLGVAMTAARDEPRRAAGFGVDPARSRAAAMTISGALAGLAGLLYLVSVPSGIAPGAFGAARSLDVVGFAVVGGLGSALGAATGAAVLLLAGVVLPSPWASVASGAGLLWVVLFAPAGLGAPLAVARDRLALGLRLPGMRQPAPPRPPAAAAPEAGPEPSEAVAVVAGSDTRDAAATPTVRVAALAAALFSAPALAALFGAPMAVRDHLGVDPGAAAPWLVLALAAGAAVAARLAWTSPTASPALVGLVAAAAVGAFAATDDGAMLAGLTSAGPVAAGWALARLARLARAAVPWRSRSAAAGLVAAASAGASVGAFHLAAVAGGNGLVDAGRWAMAYLVGATAASAAAAARWPADAGRAAERDRPSTGLPTARRRWAPLRVEGLSVAFGAGRVLDGVDLEVASGEVVALVGPNGSGKSTLLRAVAGFVDAEAGRVDVAGEELTGLRADERAAAGVALVSGARPVFADMTVRDNLRVGAYLSHRTRASFDAALGEVLRLVPRLAPLLDQRAGVLSGGEQRHLAVAQTLFRRPAVLLADELTLGLDAASQAGVLRLLRALADDGVGVMVVDHDLPSVTAAADRTVVLHDGRAVPFDDAAGQSGLRSARFLGAAR